jgi:hypothetical protein
MFDIFENDYQNQQCFSFILKVVDDNTLKVIDLFPDDKHIGKGISIAIILHAKELFNKRIISSSNKFKTFPNESRFEDAEKKVWNKLVDLELALYNKDLDYYYTI